MRSSSTATSSASGPSGQSVSIDGPCGALDEGASSDNRTKQLLSSITPADVLSLQEVSLEELAGRLRATVSRLALARQSALSLKDFGTALKQAVEDFGRLCLLSLLSDEARHCKLIGLNLETLQHVAPPEGLWQAVISRAKLQPKQVAHIQTAYQCCEQQQAILLQKQRETLAVLQAVLISGNAQCPQTSDSSAKPGATAAPAAAAGTLAGSAHHVQKPEHMQAASTQAQDAAGPAAPATPHRTLPHAGTEQTGTDEPSGIFTAQQLQALTDMCSRHARAADQDDAAVCCMVQGGSDLLDAAGVLTLECADKAEQLLQDLERISRSLKQNARRLSTTFINKLTVEQHADCIVAAYPFLLDSPALCAQVALMFPAKTL